MDVPVGYFLDVEGDRLQLHFFHIIVLYFLTVGELAAQGTLD